MGKHYDLEQGFAKSSTVKFGPDVEFPTRVNSK